MPARQTAQPRIIAHSIDLFQGGMDSDASPYMLPPGSASLGENIEFYRDNTIRSRAGYTFDATQAIDGEFTVQRINGTVQRVFRNGLTYYAGTTPLGTAANKHSFVRILNGVLMVEDNGIKLYDQDGLAPASVNTPASLTGSPSGGGLLKEGIYTYVYNYLLKGGSESPQSAEFKVTVPSDDQKVTLTIPAIAAHPKLFKIRLYRQGPTDGFPLFIKELPVGTTSYVDTGDKQSALIPTQGIRQMPGGNLALIHNRRLFVVKEDTLNYSYPGNYAYSNVFWTERINLPTGEPIRAMAPLGQGIIFFGLETALYMNGAPSEGGTFNPMPIPDGCVSQTAWTQAEDGTLFYVGKSGVYAMNGAQAQRISDPVNNEFKDLTVGELAGTTLVYDQQERRLLVSLPGKILAYYFQTKSWSVWTIPAVRLDWFEGRLHMHKDGKFGILGESPTDNGAAIQGKFVSGVHGLDDALQFKLFRRIGLQVSAGPDDNVDMSVRALDSNQVALDVLPNRPIPPQSTWNVAIWNTAQWGGNVDSTSTVALPDYIQGRYIQFTITFTTTNASKFVLMGPVVIEYRQRYRYGRV